MDIPHENNCLFAFKASYTWCLYLIITSTRLSIVTSSVLIAAARAWLAPLLSQRSYSVPLASVRETKARAVTT